MDPKLALIAAFTAVFLVVAVLLVGHMILHATATNDDRSQAIAQGEGRAEGKKMQ